MARSLAKIPTDLWRLRAWEFVQFCTWSKSYNGACASAIWPGAFQLPHPRQSTWKQAKKCKGSRKLAILRQAAEVQGGDTA